MLLEFSVENFRSFREKQTLSLVASTDKAHEGNLIAGEKQSLLKVAAVYGANASGKSNLVTAIRFMASFIQQSATTMTQGDKIQGAVPFRLDRESEGEPSSFEVTVIVEGVRYVYGFSVTPERVHGEWLDAYPKGRPRRWFEREGDPADWTFNKPLRGDQTTLKERTRANGLVLSRGAELNIAPLSKLFLWFRKKLWTFDLSDPPQVFWNTQKTAQVARGDKSFRDRVTRLLHHADLGISGIRFVEKPMTPDGMPSILREMLSDHMMKQLGDGTRFQLLSSHQSSDGDAAIEFDFEEAESNGTKRLFALAGPLLVALDQGSVVVADELDCSMHPLLTRKLIELFQSPEANKKGAQLVFTTHDSSMMDQTLFRRDQIWFTEKNTSGATDLFSLYDFKTDEGKPRVNEAFERRYLAGRYGAVPQFGPALEDAELE